MRFQAAVLGCLAILSTALPAVERRDEPALAITSAPSELSARAVSLGLYTTTQPAVVEVSPITGLEKRARKKKASTSTKKNSTTKSKKKKKKTTKTKTKAAKATKTKAAKATKTKGAKATKTKGAKATKTKGAKATKTKPAKATGTGKLGTFKVCEKGTCGSNKSRLGCKAPPATAGTGKKGKGKGTGSTKKTTTAAQRVRRSLQDLSERAVNYLFGRSEVKLDLSSKEIAAQLNKAKSAWLGTKKAEPNTGVDRYLGSTGTNPNDLSWDAFTPSDPFYRQVDGLEGCTVVFITTPKGVFTWHLWEGTDFNPFKKDPTTWDANTKKMSEDAFRELVLEQVAHGKNGNQNIKLGTVVAPQNFENQFGLKDSKIPADSWSDLSKVKIAIMTPNINKKGGGVNLGAGVIPKASWKTKLRYGNQINELVTKIKATIGHVGARQIQVWGYHTSTPDANDATNVHNTDANGKATIAWDGQSYAVYLESKKMFTDNVEPEE